jgi:hypothetical protein
MKQLTVKLILLLVFLVFSNVLGFNISKADTDLRVAYPVPEGIQDSPYSPTIPENFNGTYLNTTNPYAIMATPTSAIDEVDDIEGHHPIYVLVAGDEEERTTYRRLGETPVDWKNWAKMQIERGDEALVANFGVDIRILGFIEWYSDDSKTTITDLWYDLESKTKQYLRQVYSGDCWSNYVDAVVGISAQTTTDRCPGAAPGSKLLDQGRIFVVLKWQVYWMDDNIVQHEFSHLFYADDHYVPHHTSCCVMEGDTHWISYIWEDGLWWVFNDIPCCSLTYSWCNESADIFYPRQCFSLIDQHKNRYQSDLPIFLGWYCPYNSICITIYEWYDEESDVKWCEVFTCPPFRTR